ncbi:MAG: hypothetical protein ACK5MP_03710 [Nostocoides sp.]
MPAIVVGAGSPSFASSPSAVACAATGADSELRPGQRHLTTIPYDCAITFEVVGGGGGHAFDQGRGAKIFGTMLVAAGTDIVIWAGGGGVDGTATVLGAGGVGYGNGGNAGLGGSGSGGRGGGGGASAILVRTAASPLTFAPVIVAGGGGGGNGGGTSGTAANCETFTGVFAPLGGSDAVDMPGALVAADASGTLTWGCPTSQSVAVGVTGGRDASGPTGGAGATASGPTYSPSGSHPDVFGYSAGGSAGGPHGSKTIPNGTPTGCALGGNGGSSSLPTVTPPFGTFTANPGGGGGGGYAGGGSGGVVFVETPALSRRGGSGGGSGSSYWGGYLGVTLIKVNLGLGPISGGGNGLDGWVKLTW